VNEATAAVRAYASMVAAASGRVHGEKEQEETSLEVIRSEGAPETRLRLPVNSLVLPGFDRE